MLFFKELLLFWGYVLLLLLFFKQSVYYSIALFQQKARSLEYVKQRQSTPNRGSVFCFCFSKCLL